MYGANDGIYLCQAARCFSESIYRSCTAVDRQLSTPQMQDHKILIFIPDKSRAKVPKTPTQHSIQQLDVVCESENKQHLPSVNVVWVFFFNQAWERLENRHQERKWARFKNWSWQCDAVRAQGGFLLTFSHKNLKWTKSPLKELLETPVLGLIDENFFSFPASLQAMIDGDHNGDKTLKQTSVWWKLSPQNISSKWWRWSKQS